MKMVRDLRIVRGTGTKCSSCGRLVPTSQPVLLVEDPATKKVLGFFHRTCIAGAEELASKRPGELDLIMVYMPGTAERN